MIGALLLGPIAGALGRALVPNDVFEGMHGPRSWFDLGGLLSALIGVVIVLLLAGFLARNNGRRRPSRV